MAKRYAHHRQDYLQRIDVTFDQVDERHEKVVTFLIAGFTGGILVLLNVIATFVFRKPETIPTHIVPYIACTFIVLLLLLSFGLVKSLDLLATRRHRSQAAANIQLLYPKIGREIDEDKYAENGGVYPPGHEIVARLSSPESIDKVLSDPVVAGWFVPGAKMDDVREVCRQALQLIGARQRTDAEANKTTVTVILALSASALIAIASIIALLIFRAWPR